MLPNKSPEKPLFDLIQATKFDRLWFENTEKTLGLQPHALKSRNLLKEFWQDAWGKLEFFNQDGQKGYVWHRPDGGPDFALLDKTAKNIKIAKFALYVKVIESLLSRGNLSFVTIGFPSVWNSTKILVNGMEIQRVVSADALLRVVHVVDEDPSGSPMQKDGKIQESMIRPQTLEILVQNKPLGFF